MQGGSKGIDLVQYSPNSEWDLINTTATVEIESGEAAIIYTLKIKRKPRYMVMSVILPIVMLTALNLFVFVLPCDSGEKASYAVTVFLAFAVFLTIISAALPRNSESLSIFSVYIIILTVQSTLITMTALIVIRIRQFETPVPKVIASITNFLHCECCRRERNVVVPEDAQISSNGSVVPMEGFVTTKKVTAENIDKTNSGDDDHAQDVCDWKKVANGLDRLLFCFFTIVTVVSSMVCLIYASSAAE